MARKSYSEEEREQIREALLDTVLTCIVERGLTHSSIEFLCKKVGISKSFFYTFFSSKEELVLQALYYQQPKVLQYAKTLMENPKLRWREGVEQFLRDCCYSNKTRIAVLSLEEEQDVHRCLAPENYQAFQHKQIIFYGALLEIFGLPVSAIDPRLFGNLTLTMIMVRKAIPDSMPFLFAEVAEDMVEFHIRVLVDEMERVKQSDKEKVIESLQTNL